MLSAICLHFKGALWQNKPRSLEFWAVCPGHVSYSSKGHGRWSPSDLEPRNGATFYEEWRSCNPSRRGGEGKVLFSLEENLNAVYLEFCLSIFKSTTSWRKQGSHSGKSACLPPMWPGLDSGPEPCVILFSCWFSSRFSSLHKSQHLQIPIQPG